MKKLMTVLATAATALFAASAVADGEFSESAENFESWTAGKAFDSNNGLNGYWLTAATADEMTVSNHEESVTFPSRPDLWNGAANSNYLQLDVSTPLARGLEEVDGGAFPGVAIGDGIYLDTLVKFTAADEPFSADLDSGDKIAIEYVDQTTDNPEGYKGFVIRAGQTVDKKFGQANYFAAAPDGFNVNAWHRLTVRSIEDVGDGQVGFVIYLDGNVNPLAYDKDFDAGFGTLDTAVAEKFYNSGFHALFPSALDAVATGGTEISAVAFSGTGGIDDVVITKRVPNFIASGEGVVVPFTVDAGVAAISVKVGEGEPIAVDMTADTLSATLPSGTTAFTVTATVDTDHGYEFVSMTVGDAVYSVNPASVEGYAGDAITITTTRNNFNLFDADGEPIEGTFQTLSAALAEDGVAMIKLAYDYDVAENEVASFVTYAINNAVTLDLNGNTITAVDTQEEVLFTVGAGAELLVIDSVGGGAIDYDTEYGVFGGEGDTVVGATSGDFGPTIIGPLLDAEEDPAVLVVRAKLDGEGNSDTEDKFAFEDYIAKGSDVSDDLVNGYWVVAPQGVIGTYTVNVTPTANATYAAAYKVGGEAITPANDVITVTVGQTIVITATPAEDYEYAEAPTGWTAGQDGKITIEVSAAGTVAIPAPTEKSSGYDSGDGEHTFVIDSETEDELETNLPEDKKLSDPVSAGSSLTYAQAYALGLWDAQATAVTDLDATISVGADGKVTVTLANEPTKGYLVQCKVYEKASLTDKWPTEAKATYAYGSEQAFTPGSATAGFYKVEVVISNALQQ